MEILLNLRHVLTDVLYTLTWHDAAAYGRLISQIHRKSKILKTGSIKSPLSQCNNNGNNNFNNKINKKKNFITSVIFRGRKNLSQAGTGPLIYPS